MSPTYKNVTSLRQNLNGKVIEPGKTIFTLPYYDENKVKLLKINDAPYFNPTILSTIVTEKGEIKIPEKDNLGERVEKYAIHFYLEKGGVTIFYNSRENTPPLHLYPSAKWNVRCRERMIDKIILDACESFILNIIVEKI